MVFYPSDKKALVFALGLIRYYVLCTVRIHHVLYAVINSFAMYN